MSTLFSITTVRHMQHTLLVLVQVNDANSKSYLHSWLFTENTNLFNKDASVWNTANVSATTN